MSDLSKILTIADEIIKLKDELGRYINDVKDKKVRKKLLEALDKGDMAAVRSVLFDL